PRHVVLPELPAPRAPPGGLGREDRLEPAGPVERVELGVAADRLPVDQDLRDGPAAGQVEQLLPEVRLVVEVDLLVGEALRLEQRLRADAEATPVRRVHLDSIHYL